ncbi:hypothetical protein PEPMIC_00643 [Parvimonas micra ATCC 33270]|uniref:Uncharacterized protein n=1 Tax=Parvimonas micra ATCC 33270 TaxID=411465 RepID=A8SKC6_9FIRM|nr:hypothetical protein PEPMIC_00643 [Parvimonas micra ATCC 33270]
MERWGSYCKKDNGRSDGVIVAFDTMTLEISTIACFQAIVFLKEIENF